MPKAPTGSITVYTKFFGSVGDQPARRGTDSPSWLVGSTRAISARHSARRASCRWENTTCRPLRSPTARSSQRRSPASACRAPTSSRSATLRCSTATASTVRSARSGCGWRGWATTVRRRRRDCSKRASALQSLGYTATIVAGSSPQDMPVLVSGYAQPGTGEPGGERIGDLGTITQPWSRLGAVIEAETAVSATSVALLAICIVAVGVLLAVVQLGRGARAPRGCRGTAAGGLAAITDRALVPRRGGGRVAGDRHHRRGRGRRSPRCGRSRSAPCSPLSRSCSSPRLVAVLLGARAPREHGAPYAHPGGRPAAEGHRDLRVRHPARPHEPRRHGVALAGRAAHRAGGGDRRHTRGAGAAARGSERARRARSDSRLDPAGHPRGGDPRRRCDTRGRLAAPRAWAAVASSGPPSARWAGRRGMWCARSSRSWR